MQTRVHLGQKLAVLIRKWVKTIAFPDGSTFKELTHHDLHPFSLTSWGSFQIQSGYLLSRCSSPALEFFFISSVNVFIWFMLVLTLHFSTVQHGFLFALNGDKNRKGKSCYNRKGSFDTVLSTVPVNYLDLWGLCGKTHLTHTTSPWLTLLS